MDIDDILASVSGPRIAQETLDLQALTRAWIAERTAPELLPYPGELVERVSARLRAQIELVEEMTGNMDPKSNFSLIVIQTELERFKFLLRSFLRARIAKLDKHTPHYLAAHTASTTTTPSQPLLSPTEQAYATHRSALLSQHVSATFLSSFPTALQRLDDTAGGISMVEGPDLDQAVFVRGLRDGGTVEVQGEREVVEIEVRRGDVWVLRWSGVRELVLGGLVECV